MSDRNYPVNPFIFFTDRHVTVMVFSLFFSWLLAFAFEGHILYELAAHHEISVHRYVFPAMAAHFVGLALSGLFIKTQKHAKLLIMASILLCGVASSVFFMAPTIIWDIGLIVASFLVGCSVAAWGFFYRSSTPKQHRIRTMAEALIGANLLMILIDMVTIHVSHRLGLGLSMLILFLAFVVASRLPSIDSEEGRGRSNAKSIGEGLKPLAFLCLFIFVITINSGLMYQVQLPAFSHLQWLTSWYWAIPYIVALLILRNLPRRANRDYLLYVAIAMIGFSFISLMVLDRSVVAFLIVNTLMLGACGIYDLFWWSILGEWLDDVRNPAHVLGMGLSANVLGILVGGWIGNMIQTSNEESAKPAFLAFAVVCLTLLMLPPLNNVLNTLWKNHTFTIPPEPEMPRQNPQQILRRDHLLEQLTDRESEVATLLYTGKTYGVIANELGVTENTIKTHVKNIYAKAGVRNRTALIHLLFQDSVEATGEE